MSGPAKWPAAGEALRVDRPVRRRRAPRRWRAPPRRPGGGACSLARRRRSSWPQDLHKPRPPHRASGDERQPSTYHFCGIGGSGMLPLAAIVRATGASVSRLRPRARRRAPRRQVRLSAQPRHRACSRRTAAGCRDGATLVTSAAVEASMSPTSSAPRELGLAHLTRPELLAQLLNAARDQHRGRRHQRQVDRHRDDRLDPPRDAAATRR